MSIGNLRLGYLAILVIVVLISGNRASGQHREEEPYRVPDNSVQEAVQSPDGSRAVYLESFRPYAGEPAVITILDTEKESEIHRFALQKTGRTIDALSWLGARYVLVDMEFYLSILDADTGRVEHHFPGVKAAISPDQAHIAARLPRAPIYGPRPAGEIDFIVLAWLQQGQEQGYSREEAWQIGVVKPVVMPLDESFTSFEVGQREDRQLLVSPFAWSQDSRSLAFVEWYSNAHWLVSMEFSLQEGHLVPQARRFKLHEFPADRAYRRWVGKITWTRDQNFILLEANGETRKIPAAGEGWQEVELDYEGRP